MPSGIEATDSMFSAREVPWHRLGVVVEDSLTANEAVSAAGLDWDVTKELVYVRTGPRAYDEVPNRFATIRSDTGGILGVVGSDYEPIQNRDAFGFADSIVDSGAANFETGGSLWSGKRTFLTMKFPDEVLVGGEDPVNLFLVLTNSHNGSSALQAVVSPVRVVCQNTLSMALGSARTAWSVRHVVGAMGRVEEARRALDLTFTYTEEFQEVASGLMREQISETELDRLLERLLPDKPRTEQVAGTIKAIYNDSPTLADVRGTKWGALNAVNEYAAWVRPAKTDQSRLLNVWYGSTKKLTDKALALLTAA